MCWWGLEETPPAERQGPNNSSLSLIPLASSASPGPLVSQITLQYAGFGIFNDASCSFTPTTLCNSFLGKLIRILHPSYSEWRREILLHTAKKRGKKPISLISSWPKNRLSAFGHWGFFPSFHFSLLPKVVFGLHDVGSSLWGEGLLIRNITHLWILWAKGRQGYTTSSNVPITIPFP